MKNPHDDKFRVLKKSNKVIAAKLMSLKPPEKLLELIAALGYQELDEESSAFIGECYVVLNNGAIMIEDEAMRLKMLFMTEEERRKQELIQQNKMEMRAKMHADAEYKRQLAELSMKDRHAKAQEKAQAAKANELKFGANIKKFQPPPEAKRG